ncbi:MAG TPA: thiamine-phosphate kinase [Candidatus Methylomirabilis sp.]|nr:thiamine-phosphate kinase [Candidatus Methylomirabilis sp.]
MTPGNTLERRFNRAAGEADILRRIKAAFAQSGAHEHGLQLGVGDDAALWRPSQGHEVILSCDWSLEGTHFLRDKHPPDSVGWKCLARALSDIAAMGGIPRCFLLSLALPASRTGRWLDAFLSGLRRASRRFACTLVGGDTTRHQRILVSVTVLGEIRPGHALLRSRALPGHVLYTTGCLGQAELGLRLITKRDGRVGSRDPLLRKHLYPEPRLALGQWLARKRLASAMMDLSDGLSTDLSRLCVASRVGARVFSERIPAVRLPRRLSLSHESTLELALHGGDDYELLFTVPPGKLRRVPRSFQGIPLTAIGEVTKSRNIVLRDDAGHERPLQARGWDPFRHPGRR